MKKIFSTTTVFFLMLMSLVSHASNYYPQKLIIPEPMLFDLVRRINSDKGELEFNTLIVHDEASELKELKITPEIEFAYADGHAVELELSTVNGKLHAYKAAFQSELPAFVGDVDGIQLIYEKFHDKSIHDLTPLFIVGKKFNDNWSTIAMVGNKFLAGQDHEVRHKQWRELPIVNLSLFNHNSDDFVIGLESNLRGVGASFEEFLLIPQIHTLTENHFKLQAGLGMAYDGYVFSPVSVFRLIKEYNYDFWL